MVFASLNTVFEFTFKISIFSEIKILIKNHILVKSYEGLSENFCKFLLFFIKFNHRHGTISEYKIKKKNSFNFLKFLFAK